MSPILRCPRLPYIPQSSTLVMESFIAIFESNCALLPERRLYTWLNEDVSEARSLTYAELRQQAATLCCALRQRWKVAVQARVLLVYPPGLDFLIAFFACQYARVIAVPFYPPQLTTSLLPGERALRLLADGIDRLRRVAEGCGPALILTSRAYLRAKWAASIAARGAAGCAWPAEWTWQSTDDLAPISVVEERWLNEWLAERFATGGETAGGELALLQYTSGSTGSPKGVAVSDSNLLANIRHMKGCSSCSRAAGVGDAVALVSWLPQYHDMGLIGGCLAPAVLGWRADLMAPASFLRRPAAWLEAISRLHGVCDVISPAPNFGYALCVKRVARRDIERLKLHRWRVAMNGAEPVRAATLADFGARFAPCGFDPAAWANVYGLAEACLYTAGGAEWPAVLALDRRRLGVGESALAPADYPTPMLVPGCLLPAADAAGHAVRVVHPDTRTPLDDGHVGEIWLAGPSVCGGYWGVARLQTNGFGAELLAAPTAAPPLAAQPSAPQLDPPPPPTERWIPRIQINAAAPDRIRVSIAWDPKGAATVGEGERAPGGLGPQQGVATTGLTARWLRTGDLGLVWAGRLYLVGRMKEVLLARGRTMHMQESRVDRRADACMHGSHTHAAWHTDHTHAWRTHAMHGIRVHAWHACCITMHAPVRGPFKIGVVCLARAGRTNVALTSTWRVKARGGSCEGSRGGGCEGAWHSGVRHAAARSHACARAPRCTPPSGHRVDCGA